MRTPPDLTVDEVRAVVHAAADHPLGVAVRLLFVVGLRVSEVRGLAVDDVDLDTGTFTVRRAAPAAGVAEPKNTGALGTRPLPTSVAQLVPAAVERRHRLRTAAGARWVDPTGSDGRHVELLVPSAHGGAIAASTLRHAVRDVADAGLDPAVVARLGTHSGRRAAVTTAVQAGLPLELVARHVGHAAASITAGYVTGLRDRPAEVSAVIDGLLGGGAG